MDPMTSTPSGSAQVADLPVVNDLTQNPWVCLVWDDPVNTMSFVTHVFATYFGYPKPKAEMLMMQVHTRGKAAVASGGREEMESHVNAMHAYGLWATLDRAE